MPLGLRRTNWNTTTGSLKNLSHVSELTACEGLLEGSRANLRNMYAHVHGSSLAHYERSGKCSVM